MFFQLIIGLASSLRLITQFCQNMKIFSFFLQQFSIKSKPYKVGKASRLTLYQINKTSTRSPHFYLTLRKLAPNDWMVTSKRLLSSIFNVPKKTKNPWGWIERQKGQNVHEDNELSIYQSNWWVTFNDGLE
jgi:hypothetical protein